MSPRFLTIPIGNRLLNLRWPSAHGQRKQRVATIWLAFSLVTLTGNAFSQLSPTTSGNRYGSAKDPLFAEARAAVSRALKDPASAQFLAVRIRSTKSGSHSERIVCGFVRETEASSGGLPWIYLEATKEVHIIASKRDKKAVDLIFAFCP